MGELGKANGCKTCNDAARDLERRWNADHNIEAQATVCDNDKPCSDCPYAAASRRLNVNVSRQRTLKILERGDNLI